MGRLLGNARLVPIIVSIQALAGCAWVNNDPIEMKLAGNTAVTTPCVASNLGKEFQDALPVVNRGNTRDSVEIEVNAPRGGMIAFITIDPLPSGDSHVTIYDGQLYWPRRTTSGVFPDVARDNWHRAERAVIGCNKPA